MFHCNLFKEIPAPVKLQGPIHADDATKPSSSSFQYSSKPYKVDGAPSRNWQASLYAAHLLVYFHGVRKNCNGFLEGFLKISNRIFLCHLVSFAADILCYGRENPIQASSDVDIIHNADQLIPGVSPLKWVAVFYVRLLSCPYLRGQLLILKIISMPQFTLFL